LSAFKVCSGPPNLRRALERRLMLLCGLRFDLRPPLLRRLHHRRLTGSRQYAFLHADDFPLGGNGLRPSQSLGYRSIDAVTYPTVFRASQVLIDVTGSSLSQIRMARAAHRSDSARPLGAHPICSNLPALRALHRHRLPRLVSGRNRPRTW
jgi:hypothetical protein